MHNLLYRGWVVYTMNKNKELSKYNGKQTQLKWIKISVSSIEHIIKKL